MHAQEINGKPHWQNAKGSWVPVDMISGVDQLRTEVIDQALHDAQLMRDEAQQQREKIWGNLQDFLQIAATEHGTTYGGVKGNVNLTSYDGLRKVNIAVEDIKVANEAIYAAKQLVDQCVKQWTASGVNSELQVIVNEFFNIDKQGRLDFNLFNRMKRWDIQDAIWIKAMHSIDQAIDVIGTSKYLRFYQRKSTDDKWEMLNMDLNKIE